MPILKVKSFLKEAKLRFHSRTQRPKIPLIHGLTKTKLGSLSSVFHPLTDKSLTEDSSLITENQAAQLLRVMSADVLELKVRKEEKNLNILKIQESRIVMGMALILPFMCESRSIRRGTLIETSSLPLPISR